MLDITTCAMAFRILRMNGYDVSSGIFLILDFFSSLTVFNLRLSSIVLTQLFYSILIIIIILL